jgi:hypothetical protein
MQNDKIVWEAPEYIYREKHKEWFVGLGVIALALFVVAILFKNFLFAAIVVLATFTILLYATRRPYALSFEINRVGVILNRTFYPYSFLDAFWVDYTDESVRKLFIVSRKFFMPMLIIPLGEQDPDEVRNFLTNYLPERELLEPLSHKILEYFGF